MILRSRDKLSRWLAPLRIFRSTRWKITLATVLATGLVLALLATGIYGFIHSVQSSSLRNEATLKMHSIRLALEQGELPAQDQTGDRLPVEITVGERTLYTDPLLTNLGWSDTLSQRLPEPWISRGDQVEAGSVEQFPFTSSDSWHPWANNTLDVVYTDIPAELVPLELGDTHQTVRITLVVFDFTHESLFAFLPRALSIAVAGTTLIVAGVSFAAVTWALRPVGRIRRKLQQISAEDLSQRLWVPQTGDEIQALAEEGNAALKRLEAAERSQQQFIANAAHDLRSPLASLYSTLEIARLYPASQNPEQTLRDAETQVKRLIGLAEQLLELDQLKSLQQREHPEFGLQQVLTEVRELHCAPWPVTVETSCGLPLTVRLAVSQQHFVSALSNVLANAQRHAKSRVKMHVRYHTALPLAQDPESLERLTIIVANDGAEIPRTDRDRIFQRFTRLDESRSGSLGGGGLGLAITAQVMDAAGGSVRTGREDGMTTFILNFPVRGSTPGST